MLPDTSFDIDKYLSDIIHSIFSGEMKSISFDLVKSLEESKIKQSINSNSNRKKAMKPNTSTNKSTNLLLEESIKSDNIYENMKNINENDEAYVDLAIDLPTSIKDRLFEHQQVAVEWLTKIHVRYPGCILGDDMGMGKTFSVISFLCNLYVQKQIERTLILCPVSVLENWSRELNTYLTRYLPSLSIHLINADVPKNRREKILNDVFHFPKHGSHCSIVISSYTLVSNMVDIFARVNQRASIQQRALGGYKDPYCDSNVDPVARIVWDYVILDEGHIMKNPSTKLYKAMHALPTQHRVIMTGTPIQNNLTEFWALIDWVSCSSLIGSKKEFLLNFSNPITEGQNPEANMDEQTLGRMAAKNLYRLTSPILLQRKKTDKEHEKILNLPVKTELTIWIPLSVAQYRKSTSFIAENGGIAAAHQHPVEVISKLRCIARHPFLLELTEANNLRKQNGGRLPYLPTTRNTAAGNSEVDGNAHRKPTGSSAIDNLLSKLNGLSLVGVDTPCKPGNVQNNLENMKNSSDVDTLEASFQSMSVGTNHNQNPNGFAYTGYDEDEEAMLFYRCRSLPASATIFEMVGRTPPLEELMEGSIKLQVLLKMTQRLLRRGHRMLVFSQSKAMIDIIRFVLDGNDIESMSIDGTVVGRDRQNVVDRFNSEKCVEDGPHVCLLTTKACGTGITLTGADRVIIFDPSWNPAEDRQAVDRAYRIGQQRNVVVYRLVLCGCIEEKMYEKQVFKDGVRVVTENGDDDSHYQKYFSHSETSDLFRTITIDNTDVLQRFWTLGGKKMISCSDLNKNTPIPLGMENAENAEETQKSDGIYYSDTVPSDIKGVCGYTRHDMLYVAPPSERNVLKHVRNLPPPSPAQKKILKNRPQFSIPQPTDALRIPKKTRGVIKLGDSPSDSNPSAHTSPNSTSSEVVIEYLDSPQEETREDDACTEIGIGEMTRNDVGSVEKELYIVEGVQGSIVGLELDLENDEPLCSHHSEGGTVVPRRRIRRIIEDDEEDDQNEDEISISKGGTSTPPARSPLGDASQLQSPIGATPVVDINSVRDIEGEASRNDVRVNAALVINEASKSFMQLYSDDSDSDSCVSDTSKLDLIPEMEMFSHLQEQNDEREVSTNAGEIDCIQTKKQCENHVALTNDNTTEHDATPIIKKSTFARRIVIDDEDSEDDVEGEAQHPPIVDFVDLTEAFAEVTLSPGGVTNPLVVIDDADINADLSDVNQDRSQEQAKIRLRGLIDDQASCSDKDCEEEEHEGENTYDYGDSFLVPDGYESETVDTSVENGDDDNQEENESQDIVVCIDSDDANLTDSPRNAVHSEVVDLDEKGMDKNEGVLNEELDVSVLPPSSSKIAVLDQDVSAEPISLAEKTTPIPSKVRVNRRLIIDDEDEEPSEVKLPTSLETVNDSSSELQKEVSLNATIEASDSISVQSNLESNTLSIQSVVVQFLKDSDVSVVYNDVGSVTLDLDAYNKLTHMERAVVGHFIEVTDGGNATFPVEPSLHSLPAVFEICCDHVPNSCVDHDASLSMQRVTAYIEGLELKISANCDTPSQETSDTGLQISHVNTKLHECDSSSLFEDASDVIVPPLKVSFADISSSLNDSHLSEDFIPCFNDSINSYPGSVFNPISISATNSTTLNVHLSDKSRRRLYNLLLQLARIFETNLLVTNFPNFSSACTCYMSALLLFDEEMLLHRKLAWLSQQI